MRYFPFTNWISVTQMNQIAVINEINVPQDYRTARFLARDTKYLPRSLGVEIATNTWRQHSWNR